MLVGRCHHNKWPHSCDRCKWELEHLDDIEAHDVRYWYGTARMFLDGRLEKIKECREWKERCLKSEAECRALRRHLEMERQQKRGDRQSEIMREEDSDTRTITDVGEEKS